MTEKEKQQRADNTSADDLEVRITEVAENLMAIYSIVSRWTPERRRRVLNNNPKISAAYEMCAAYLESSRSMLAR